MDTSLIALLVHGRCHRTPGTRLLLGRALVVRGVSAADDSGDSVEHIWVGDVAGVALLDGLVNEAFDGGVELRRGHDATSPRSRARMA
jgi:hypothetical protein